MTKKNWSSEKEVGDPWSWGKFGLKIIPYQGVRVPVACTPHKKPSHHLVGGDEKEGGPNHSFIFTLTLSRERGVNLGHFNFL